MNLAWTGFFTRLNAANEAYAQYGDGNVAAVWVTGNDRKAAVVDGQLSTATARPGSNNRVIVLGFNKSHTKPAAAAGVRVAPQR